MVDVSSDVCDDERMTTTSTTSEIPGYHIVVVGGEITYEPTPGECNNCGIVKPLSVHFTDVRGEPTCESCGIAGEFHGEHR
jgi:hypothetical protein